MKSKITLKAARVNAGFTIDEAAKKIGVSYPTLWGMEHGKSPISIPNYAKICSLYNIKPEDLKVKVRQSFFAETE